MFPDKNFEDEDSVDGGRSTSSSSSKPSSVRRTVVSVVRRPSAASASKITSERLDSTLVSAPAGRMTTLQPEIEMNI